MSSGCSRRFYVQCTTTIHTFVSWTKDELRPFRLGTKVTRRDGSEDITYQDHLILAPYDRVLCQLAAEDSHGDTNTSHEACRRQCYAQRVLDEFALEFTAYRGTPTDFRSVVLSPILQRQLRGVQDSYLPCVNGAIGGSPSDPTLEQVTNLYLGIDPTDPELAASYRRNILFVPEARWHLGTVIGSFSTADIAMYNRVRANQDLLMSWLKECGEDDDDTEPIVFSPLMVTIVKDEGLDLFYGRELSLVVRIPPHLAI